MAKYKGYDEIFDLKIFKDDIILGTEKGLKVYLNSY